MALGEGDLPVLETTRDKFQMLGPKDSPDFVEGETLGLAVAPDLVEGRASLQVETTANDFVHH